MPEQFAREAEREAEREAMVSELASQLHDEWRASRRQEDGSYEPRIKSTRDESWISAHGTDKVDIANTPFSELPDDWKGENQAAAEVVVGVVFDAIDSGQELDDEFIESASSVVHEEWVKRNEAWAPDELKKPFKELSEEEQEKDRSQVRKAIEIYTSR